jgi:hypothetical protein
MKLAQLSTWLRDWICRMFPWRDRPRLERVVVGYEKAGIVIHDEPIAWNADTVIIEVEFSFPIAAAEQQRDFWLEICEGPPILSVIQPSETESDDTRLVFRLPVPRHSACANLCWRDSVLRQVPLPLLRREEFLGHLRMDCPTLFARLGELSVQCQAIVEGQCRGLLATAMLRSPTSLLPILGLNPVLEFTTEHSRRPQLAPLTLTSQQLASREAIVSINLPPQAWWDGKTVLRWNIAERTLAVDRIRTVSAESYRNSLFAVDARYVHYARDGALSFGRYPFLADATCRVGPCFLIATHESGLAGLHSFVVRVQYKDAGLPPDYLEQEVLVTNGPSLFIPMTTTPERFQQISTFDLFSQGEQLAQLSVCTRDTTTFTSEGGFTVPAEYPWTAVAEAELADHLRKLMEVPRISESGT